MITGIEHKEERRGSEPRIPCPPDPPRRPPPGGTKHEGKTRQDKADFSRGGGQPVPFFLFANEIEQTTDKRNKKKKKSIPCRRDMNIQNAVNFPHHLVGRSHKQPAVLGV